MSAFVIFFFLFKWWLSHNRSECCIIQKKSLILKFEKSIKFDTKVIIIGGVCRRHVQEKNFTFLISNQSHPSSVCYHYHIHSNAYSKLIVSFPTLHTYFRLYNIKCPTSKSVLSYFYTFRIV